MTDSSATEERTALAQLSQDIEEAVERAATSAVTVYGRRRLPATGIVWSDEGWIVTANHVVERDDDVSIGLPSGERLEVSVRGRDLRSDVALLIPTSSTTFQAPQAERSKRTPRVGTIVLALGRPGKGGIMASFGTVSAIGQTMADGDDESADALRANVAMLPGFSGGPLIDGDGRLLGMNSSHLAGGLTLTAGYVSGIVQSLAEHGHVRQGYLGIGAQRVQLPVAVSPGNNGSTVDHGLLIVAVEGDGPAAGAGVLLGDVLLLVDDHPVTDVESLQMLLDGDRVGAAVNVTLLRAGQVDRRVITVGDRP